MWPPLGYLLRPPGYLNSQPPTSVTAWVCHQPLRVQWCGRYQSRCAEAYSRGAEAYPRNAEAVHGGREQPSHVQNHIQSVGTRLHSMEQPHWPALHLFSGGRNLKFFPSDMPEVRSNEFERDRASAHYGRRDILNDLSHGIAHGTCPACVELFAMWGNTFILGATPAELEGVYGPFLEDVQQYSRQVFDFCVQNRTPAERQEAESQLRTRLSECPLVYHGSPNVVKIHYALRDAGVESLLDRATRTLSQTLSQHWFQGRDAFGLRALFGVSATINIGAEVIFTADPSAAVSALILQLAIPLAQPLACRLLVAMLYWRPRATLGAVVAQKDTFFPEVCRQMCSVIAALKIHDRAPDRAQYTNLYEFLVMLEELVEKLDGQQLLARVALPSSQQPRFLSMLTHARTVAMARERRKIDYVAASISAACGLPLPLHPQTEDLGERALIAMHSPGLQVFQEVINRAIGTRICAFAGCGTVIDDGLRRCIGCKLVSYCGNEHREANWSRHKELCKLIQHIRQRASIRSPDTWMFLPPAAFEVAMNTAAITTEEIATITYWLHDGWRGQRCEQHADHCREISANIRMLLLQNAANESVAATVGPEWQAVVLSPSESM
ncbi:hypothetical protein BKA62DRAFT_721200 [Auriculariales sp. MPI-PUGE-AT-0066]|nr:hypothetical protein BKA62DRAFT_721200 [Auriculariales sp. MPI-PUGE-AT-0066]